MVHQSRYLICKFDSHALRAIFILLGNRLSRGGVTGGEKMLEKAQEYAERKYPEQVRYNLVI